MTPQEWTPISFLGSYPPSPTAACALGPSSTSDNPYFIAASATALTTTPITTAEPKFVSVPLPPIPPSPPLPPLPPKSPKTLIAQYFPRSLAPPPSRVRTPYGQRELIVSPTPFKTPTFGPALISPTFASTTTHPDAPSLPSPSASFQYIPTADISRVSTSHALQSSQHHQHLFTESDFSLSSNRPSPNVSVIGFQGSTAPTPPPPRMMPHQQHPARLPSDLDLILYNSRQRPAQLACSNSTFNKQGASSVSSNEGLGPVNTAQDEVVTSGSVVIPTAPALLFAPLRPHSPAASAGGIRATPSTTSLSNPPISPSPTILPTTPIYPRGLSFPSILGDNAQVIIRLHQKPVPYIRELVPGKETELAPTTTIPTAEAATGATRGPSSTVTFVTTSPSQPASTNTSRDLEMILDEITGRLRTNRTSMDPWAYNLSSWDDKPLPPVRRERGSRYWVFRDQGGLVLGPILFLVGHLFPPLWWVGALYPRLEHPDTVAALEAELARAAEMEAYSAACVAAVAGTGGAQVQETEEEENDARDRQNGVALQWLQRQLKTLGVTVASITLSSSSSKSQPGSSDGGNPTIATLQMVQVGTSDNDDNEREGSTLANISTIHVPYQPPLPAPMPPSILDSRGPWAARGESSRASSLFEQRMAHDRKVLRHELDLRWRRINLLWSIASLLLAICLVVIVLGVRK
ncbi:hypothetical protein BGZ47_001764 [Haplosporangium gracile]|nr:hypothetical protein BGZ47_001764 [Haplosporangium gracile]